MSILNLTRDKKYILNRVLNNVSFVYADQPNAGQLAGEAGFMSKADVKIEINPRQVDLINGQKLQLGYDMNVEITSLQFYSVFEFSKLQNRLCYIRMLEIPLWIMPVMLNVSVNLVPGETQGTVKITGSKFGDTLLDCIAPTWNGQIIDPYALDIKATDTTNIIPTDKFVRQYKLRINDPAFQWIEPPNPTETGNVDKFRVLLYKQFGEVLDSVPVNLVVRYFKDIDWVVIPDTQYILDYIGGYYYLNFDLTNLLSMGTIIEVSYNL